MTSTAVAAEEPGRPRSPFGDPDVWVRTVLAPFAAVQATFEHGHHGPDLDTMPWLTTRTRSAEAN